MDYQPPWDVSIQDLLSQLVNEDQIPDKTLSYVDNNLEFPTSSEDRQPQIDDDDQNRDETSRRPPRGLAELKREADQYIKNPNYSSFSTNLTSLRDLISRQERAEAFTNGKQNWVSNKAFV